MEFRRFVLNDEPCIIHYPEKPNGFGILVIGNRHEFVPRSGEHYWQRNETRRKILTQLLADGYTVYFSNLLGQHMGNEEAVERAGDLYEYVKRTEILNDKIHIIAEELGAKIAIGFLKRHEDNVRSILFVNPVFSLQWMAELLEEQPFLYRRFLQDIAKAYQFEEEDSEILIHTEQVEQIGKSHPFKIIHILIHGMYDEKWVKMYKKYLPGALAKLHVVLQEKNQDIVKIARELFKETEKNL